MYDKTCFLLFAFILVFRSQGFAQPDFASLKTVHFEIKYQKGITKEDAQAVAEYLESDYEYLNSTLGRILTNTVEVRLHSVEGQFLSASGQSKPWKGAVFKKNTILVQPLKELKQRDQLEKNLAYELSLAMLETAAKGGCPQWLRESFAAYHSGVGADLDVPVGMRMTTFVDVNQDIQKYAQSSKRNDLLYVLAQTMVYFLDTFGEEKAMNVFSKFDGTKSTATVFREHFGRELPDIESEWSARLNELMQRGTTRE